MDKLEKYIEKYRAGFDSEEPRNDLWAKISGELQETEPKTKWLANIKVWRAAAVILLLTTSWLIFDKIYKDDVRLPASNENGVMSEFKEVEAYYMTVVSEKRKILERAAADDPEYKDEFLNELEELDNQYEGLKENLKFGNQEEVVNALIINLQLRIEILNKQLEVIQEVNKKENESII